jgi:hypothetical protein
LSHQIDTVEMTETEEPGEKKEKNISSHGEDQQGADGDSKSYQGDGGKDLLHQRGPEESSWKLSGCKRKYVWRKKERRRQKLRLRS